MVIPNMYVAASILTIFETDKKEDYVCLLCVSVSFNQQKKTIIVTLNPILQLPSFDCFLFVPDLSSKKVHLHLNQNYVDH